MNAGFSTPCCTLVSVRLFSFPLVFAIWCNHGSTKIGAVALGGTIIERKRAKGVRYTAQIRIKRDGALIHSEAETFSKRDAAKAWIDKREKALAKPGGLEAAMKAPKGDSHTLADAIDKYLDETEKQAGRTKAQVLRTIKTLDIADKPCDPIPRTGLALI